MDVKINTANKVVLDQMRKVVEDLKNATTKNECYSKNCAMENACGRIEALIALLSE